MVGPEYLPSRSIPLMTGAGSSLMFCELGRREHARLHLDVLVARPRRPAAGLLDARRSSCGRASRARTSATPRSPRRLRALLEPYDGQFVNTGGSWFGAVAHYLALLHATLGDVDEADSQFAEAERAYAALGATCVAGALPAGLGAVAHRALEAEVTGALMGRDAGRAAALIDAALAAARGLGLARVVMRAEGLREQAGLR